MGSVGKTITKAVTDPVNQLVNSTKQVFTNPGKANLGQFVSAINPLGATIVSDIKNPTDFAVQAGAAAGVAGGAALLSGGGLSSVPLFNSIGSYASAGLSKAKGLLSYLLPGGGATQPGAGKNGPLGPYSPNANNPFGNLGWLSSAFGLSPAATSAQVPRQRTIAGAPAGSGAGPSGFPTWILILLLPGGLAFGIWYYIKKRKHRK